MAKEEDMAVSWREFAEMLNQLPVEEKKRYHALLGQFLHDVKHSLGLISNANELLRRDANAFPDKHRAKEMIGVTRTGFEQLNGYVNVMLRNFYEHIDV
jgi:hypothetical protein